MTQRARHTVLLLLALTAAAGLSGCAAGPEFTGVPQEGAQRSGVFPTIGHMPKAETAQFSTQDKDSLTTSLDADRQRLTSIPNAPGLTAAQLEQIRQQNQAEAAATLKAIETEQN